MWVMSTLFIIVVNPAVSTFLYVAAVIHVTPRDVLHELHNAVSATQRQDSCVLCVLLSNMPTSIEDLQQRLEGLVEVELMYETRPL